MKRTKLLQLLESFSPKEIQQFGDVLDSPVFNQEESVTRLGKALVNCLSNQNQLPNRHGLHREAFPNKAFNDLRLRQTMSACCRLAELVLVLDQWRGSPAFDLQVMRESARRGLQKQFNSAHRRTKAKLENSQKLLPEQFWHAFNIGLVASTHQKKQAEELDQLKRLDGLLDDFYLLTKFRQASVLHSRGGLEPEGSRASFLQSLLEFSKVRNSSQKLPGIFRLALLTQLQPEKQGHFQKLKSALHEQRASLDQVLGTELHILARNHCIRRINQGDQSYVHELFDLYQLALREGLLNDSQGYMLPSAFKNTVGTGLMLKNYVEVEEFVKVEGARLDPSIQADYLNFSLGKIRFAQGQFRAVAKLLQTVSYNDLFIELDSRILLLKTWYELGEMDLLEAALNGTRKIVRRRKIQAYHRKNYLNNLKMVERLLKQFHRKSPEKFMEDLRALPELSERAWLMEKVNASPVDFEA